MANAGEVRPQCDRLLCMTRNGAAPLNILRRLKTRVSKDMRWYVLPSRAKAALRHDLQGLPLHDPGIHKTIAGAMNWLVMAQDNSTSRDGGVARAYSLIRGWTSSYPETTGYIIPTFLEYARRTGSATALARARRMLGWLLEIQLPCGGFQGGRIDSKPVVPVVFNTGQILLGLASGEREFGGCRDALRRAADWLVDVQDADGCWRNYPSPFAGAGDKTYDTHAAWGLLEAERIEPNRGYGEAGIENIRWALSQQHENGWFANCCLSDATTPLTHTLGYALRGVVEAWRFTVNPALLVAARRTADGLLSAQRSDGFLPGQLRSDWSASAQWAGLSGMSQIAICWLMLYQDCADARYLQAAVAANRYVRRSVLFDVSGEIAGGVKGSFPIDGAYCEYEYPAWAAKFLIDSLFLETDICRMNEDLGYTSLLDGQLDAKLRLEEPQFSWTAAGKSCL
ncbi:MAG: prenyltransferase/squalene oxidase repeat-containing protein [Casimicrobiaceae bacterium]